MRSHGYNNLYNSWSGKRMNYESEETVQKAIMDEIKSIQGVKSSYRNRKPETAKYNTYEDEYRPKILVEEEGSSTVNSLHFTNRFFRNRQTITENVLQDFGKSIDLSSTNFFTSTRDYHKDNIDKLKILRFNEEKIHKLRRTFQRMLNDDLNKIQDYAIEAIRNIRTLTGDIFNEYCGVFQRKLTREYLKVLNDEKQNVYEASTQGRLRSLTRLHCDDFLKYNTFFPDLISLVNFLNENLKLKKYFLQSTKKSSALNDVPVSDYMDMFKRSIDNLMDYKSEVLRAQKNKRVNEIIKRPLSTNLSKTGLDLEIIGHIPEDSPIFELGDKTKKAEPFWKINQLIESKLIETSHHHNDVINQLVLSDDSRYAMTCSKDESIRITNLVTGENRLAIPKASEGGCASICHMSDGMLASGGRDGVIKLFDTLIGMNKGVMYGHRDQVWGMVEMPGEALVSISEDHSMKFWNTELRAETKTVMSPQNKPIRSLLRISESRLAFSSLRIWIYNVNRDEIEKSLAGHNGQVRTMTYHDNMNRLISAGEDSTLRFWNLETCECVKTLRCPEAHCLAIYKGEYLLSGHTGMEVRFWDLGLLRLICIKTTKIFVETIQVTRDGRIIYPEYNMLVVLKSPMGNN